MSPTGAASRPAMTFPALVFGLALALFATSGDQSRSTSATTVDVESIGPKIGASLPDFNLRDQRGEAHTLKSLLGPKGAVIVFFRSADW